jgi:hypothetical protein
VGLRRFVISLLVTLYTLRRTSCLRSGSFVYFLDEDCLRSLDSTDTAVKILKRLWGEDESEK